MSLRSVLVWFRGGVTYAIMSVLPFMAAALLFFLALYFGLQDGLWFNFARVVLFLVAILFAWIVIEIKIDRKERAHTVEKTILQYRLCLNSCVTVVLTAVLLVMFFGYAMEGGSEKYIGIVSSGENKTLLLATDTFIRSPGIFGKIEWYYLCTDEQTLVFGNDCSIERWKFPYKSEGLFGNIEVTASRTPDTQAFLKIQPGTDTVSLAEELYRLVDHGVYEAITTASEKKAGWSELNQKIREVLANSRNGYFSFKREDVQVRFVPKP